MITYSKRLEFGTVSGFNIPYHLRVNKSVDRQVFIDTLALINRYTRVSDCIYLGLGGPFLEDFKALHAYFGVSRMISLEENENTWKRQEFNNPLSCITCKYVTAGDYIEEFDVAENRFVVWLDYTEPRKLGQQFSEFQTLLPKLGLLDVVRITLNANPDALYQSCPDKGGKPELKTVKETKRWNKLQSRIGEFLPHDTDETWTDLKKLPELLLRALGEATKKALDFPPYNVFEPLVATAYSDAAHQMVTLTGILLPQDSNTTAAFWENTALKQWGLYNGKWGGYTRINVPPLTIKEKTSIDRHLPVLKDLPHFADEAHKALGFLFDSDQEKSTEILINYARFYRQYPNYYKIVL